MPDNYGSNNPRVPLPHQDIQVNFCKNIDCSHFGKEATPVPQKRGVHTADGYVVGTKGGQRSRLKCKQCNQYSTLKSNKGIYEEYSRISSYLTQERKIVSCPTVACTNHGIDISAGKRHYQKFGRTDTGSPRFRCKACQKTFSLSSRPTSRQRIVYKNKAIFVSILNKVTFKRICETEGISMQTIYDKIEFFDAQCMAFVAHRERQLIDKLKLERVYIASDRQDLIVNWRKTLDKRNIILKAIASAEMRSGYIFGMHTNFDPLLDPDEVEKLVGANGDNVKDIAYREFARPWLKLGYEVICRARKPKQEDIQLGELEVDIEDRYKEALQRPEIEASDDPDPTARLSYYGMQIHE